MKYIKDLIAFVQNVAKDPRIPDSDKKILLALLALIASPIDIIPDWVPILGLLDDVVMLSIVLDYFFNRLDQDILLSHYPWGMKSFIRIRRTARVFTFLTPNILKEKLWKFKPSIYQK